MDFLLLVTVDALEKHILDPFKLKENLNNLIIAEDQLVEKIIQTNRFLEDAARNLKNVDPNIIHWKTQAEELHKKAQHVFSGKDVKCYNIGLRYSLSKHVRKLNKEINVMEKKRPGLLFVEFESRLTVLNGVFEALKDDEVSMCSIFGMGGTGKTMLAKELIQRVEEYRLFDEVAMVTVSQNPNLEAIQEEIMAQLGLIIDDPTERAKRLYHWLANHKTLLILDDVWWTLTDRDFEIVGIPKMRGRCKIVLTSRSEDVCLNMGSRRNFLVHDLTREEAWDLFSLHAGKRVEDLDFKDTGRMIAGECGGLPIAIINIAKALKDRPKDDWNSALQQISNVKYTSEAEKLLRPIQLSYDGLNDKEAQSCFRLFCLFPEDTKVSAEQLAIYGKGLELFENTDTITQARDKVEKIIDKLKKSWLLLDGKEEGCVTMHDVIRDVAILMHSDLLLTPDDKEMTVWPETHKYENCSAISFKFTVVKEHPVGLRCPNLELLMLGFGDGSTGLPSGFFEGMTELKVLILQVPSLLQPLVTLKKLRTLIINEHNNWNGRETPKIGDLLGHGELKNLESFILISRRPCNDFPMEIGSLCSLRYLEFSVTFAYMPPGVLSKLVKLEELLLPWEFRSWGCKEEDGERVNASLHEIESLPLTRLKMGMKEGSLLRKKFVKKLKEFELFISSNSEVVFQTYQDESSASLDVVGVDASVLTMSWVVSLQALQRLKLVYVRNLKNLILLLKSLRLKMIEIICCEEIECFVNTTMPVPCFHDLKNITIMDCPKLKYVFPLSMAGEMAELQSMKICACHELEEIFIRDDERNQVQNIFPLIHGSETKGKQQEMVSNHQILEESISEDNDSMFPQLQKLELEHNQKLRVFYGGNEAIKLPSFEEVTIDYCENIKALSYGSVISPKFKRLLFGGEYYYEDSVEDLKANLNKWFVRKR